MRKPGRREQVRERQRAAINLRKCGASYKQIGQQLHVSEQQAWRDCRAATALVIEEMRSSALEAVALEALRLDGLLLNIWPRTQQGDPAAVVAALRVCESRRRLLGIDAPTTVGFLLRAPPDEDFSRVSFEQLQARLARAVDALAPGPPPGPPIDVKAIEAGPVGMPIPEPPPETREARLRDYEAVLAARRNGRPH